MNITCRGCNNELDNCTCNVLTTDKISYQARIKDLERINESHRIENGELRERIKELEEQLNSTRLQINGTESIKLFMNGEKTVFVKEELMPTKEESMWLLDRIGIAKYFIVNHSVIAKLQKIIGDK